MSRISEGIGVHQLLEPAHASRMWVAWYLERTTNTCPFPALAHSPSTMAHAFLRIWAWGSLGPHPQPLSPMFQLPWRFSDKPNLIPPQGPCCFPGPKCPLTPHKRPDLSLIVLRSYLKYHLLSESPPWSLDFLFLLFVSISFIKIRYSMYLFICSLLSSPTWTYICEVRVQRVLSVFVCLFIYFFLSAAPRTELGNIDTQIFLNGWPLSRFCTVFCVFWPENDIDQLNSGCKNVAQSIWWLDIKTEEEEEDNNY